MLETVTQYSCLIFAGICGIICFALGFILASCFSVGSQADEYIDHIITTHCYKSDCKMRVL